MLVEIKCPDCNKIHYFDISVSGNAEGMRYKNDEELKRIIVENIKVKSYLPAEVVQQNL